MVRHRENDDRDGDSSERARAPSGDSSTHGAGEAPARHHVTMTVLLTLVMTWSMLQLFAVAALAPLIGPDLGVGPAVLGGAVGAGFAMAAVLSPWAGRLTDRWGSRACTAALLLATAVALGLVALSRDGIWLVGALAVGGLAQALANPATNKVISTSIPPARRAGVIGWKQSGVQMGALLAGLPLVLLATALGWRVSFALVAVGAFLLALWSLAVLPRGGRPASGSVLPSGWSAVKRLVFFSFFLGVGVSSVNAHLALFSTSDLGMSAVQAGALVAVLGGAGVLGRIFWSARASGGRAIVLLGPLAAGAVLGPVLLWASVWLSPLAWGAALIVGGLAVAANAVSMVAVVSRISSSSVGRATALVTAGFFGGFAVGPPVLGLLAEALGYQVAWWWPGLSLLCAAVIMLPLAWRESAREH